MLGFMCDSSTCISFSIFFSNILRAKPLSIKTLPIRQSLHLIVIYRGLLCLVPLASSSSSMKYR
jgi:hypothetical protein